MFNLKPPNALGPGTLPGMGMGYGVISSLFITMRTLTSATSVQSGERLSIFDLL